MKTQVSSFGWEVAEAMVLGDAITKISSDSFSLVQECHR